MIRLFTSKRKKEKIFEICNLQFLIKEDWNHQSYTHPMFSLKSHNIGGYGETDLVQLWVVVEKERERGNKGWERGEIDLVHPDVQWNRELSCWNRSWGGGMVRVCGGGSGLQWAKRREICF